MGVRGERAYALLKHLGEDFTALNHLGHLVKCVLQYWHSLHSSLSRSNGNWRAETFLRIRKMISDVEWTLPNQSSIFQNTVEGQTAFIVPDQTGVGGCKGGVSHPAN